MGSVWGSGAVGLETDSFWMGEGSTVASAWPIPWLNWIVTACCGLELLVLLLLFLKENPSDVVAVLGTEFLCGKHVGIESVRSSCSFGMFSMTILSFILHFGIGIEVVHFLISPVEVF